MRLCGAQELTGTLKSPRSYTTIAQVSKVIAKDVEVPCVTVTSKIYFLHKATLSVSGRSGVIFQAVDKVIHGRVPTFPVS